MDIDSSTDNGPPPLPTRHPRYYFNDGNIVFLCEGILYNLHQSRLSIKGEFFHDMFELPQGTASTVDGQDDEHPLSLDDSGIQNVHFLHLVTFLYDQDEVVAPSLEYYTSILKLSVLWRVPSGIRYVTTHLPSHAGFTPAIQLELSRQYDLTQWAEPAFRKLMEGPLTGITLSDAQHMGVAAYYKLVKLKCKVAAHNILLAFNPPDVHHSYSCLDEPACSRVWESFWWTGYAKQLLHPDKKLAPAAILLEVDSTKGLLLHMPPLCLQYTMDAIWEHNPFNAEQEFMDEASEDLRTWMISL